MISELPQRKPARLTGFDYSSDGAYFVTVCTKNREMLFGNVGADPVSARSHGDHSALMIDCPASRIIERTFLETIAHFPGISAPIYVVMPNHFHAIITIHVPEMYRADTGSAPTLSKVMQSFKRYSTHEFIVAVKDGELPPFDGTVWQRSFHDHIIRNENDYRMIYSYIRDNPLNWMQDRFFI